jgi:hypothetical protein
MYSGITITYYRKIVGHNTVAKHVPTFIFQQDGSLAHFHCEVRQYLNSVTRTLDRASLWK